MAEIVAALGVPHTPAFPAAVERDGPDSETARFYRELRDALEAVNPDVLVVFTTDHLNTFFFDGLPTFAIGVDDAFKGPSDRTPGVPYGMVPSHLALATHLHSAGIAAGFDLTLSKGISLDHATMVPLHFLTPSRRVPVIPIFINGHLPPLPRARRAHALGAEIANAIASFPPKLRVVTIGSGSFSLEVHGPLMAPGLPFGVPSPEWAARVQRLLENGKVAELVEETTPEQMGRSGNVAGEILNWLAMLGTFPARPPEHIVQQPQFGHSYAFWRVCK